MENLYDLHQVYELFVVEYDLLDEQHWRFHFDLIVQERIVVRLDFQLEVRQARRKMIKSKKKIEK